MFTTPNHQSKTYARGIIFGDSVIGRVVSTIKGNDYVIFIKIVGGENLALAYDKIYPGWREENMLIIEYDHAVPFMSFDNFLKYFVKSNDPKELKEARASYERWPRFTLLVLPIQGIDLVF